MAVCSASELCFLAGIAGLIAAAVVGLVLAALTPVFQLLPLNVLAAVVVSGVLGVFEWDEALFLYRVSLCHSKWLTAKLYKRSSEAGCMICSLRWMQTFWVPGFSGVLGCVCHMQPRNLLAGKGCFSGERVCSCDPCIAGSWLCALQEVQLQVGCKWADDVHIDARCDTAVLPSKEPRWLPD